MYMIFLLIFSLQSIVALIYNDMCTGYCDFPGMICRNNRCLCDENKRLFWTNTRCARCPDTWTITETDCIIHYKSAMTWEQAKQTCRKQQAELISLRNRDIIPLFYNGMDLIGAWTSAHATDISGFGTYQWLDEDMNPFTNQSDWWCRKSTENLGYTYRYDEPTRYTYQTNETELCVVFWRGISKNQTVCLDDQLCSKEFEFICEKSEWTENLYSGLAPIGTNDLSTEESVRFKVIHTIPSNVDTVIVQLGSGKSQFETAGIILIILIIALILLLAFIGGIIYFYKKRSIVPTEKNNRPRKPSPISVKSVTSEIESEEPTDLPVTTSDKHDLNLQSPTVPENLNIKIDREKSRKPARGGISQQLFDEFE